MRSCDEILELISAALDGALSDAEQAELEQHLSQCPVCSALYAELDSLHEAAMELEDVPAPDGFAAQVMERIAADPVQELPGVATFPVKKRLTAHWKKWAAAAAIVAVAVLGAVSLLPGSGGGESFADAGASADGEQAAESSGAHEDSESDRTAISQEETDTSVELDILDEQSNEAPGSTDELELSDPIQDEPDVSSGNNAPNPPPAATIPGTSDAPKPSDPIINDPKPDNGNSAVTPPSATTIPGTPDVPKPSDPIVNDPEPDNGNSAVTPPPTATDPGTSDEPQPSDPIISDPEPDNGNSPVPPPPGDADEDWPGWPSTEGSDGEDPPVESSSPESYCGVLILNAALKPEGLEQYESTKDPSGAVTYTVPASYLYACLAQLQAQNAKDYLYLQAEAGDTLPYGQIVVKP